MSNRNRNRRRKQDPALPLSTDTVELPQTSTSSSSLPVEKPFTTAGKPFPQSHGKSGAQPAKPFNPNKQCDSKQRFSQPRKEQSAHGRQLSSQASEPQPSSYTQVEEPKTAGKPLPQSQGEYSAQHSEPSEPKKQPQLSKQPIIKKVADTQEQFSNLKLQEETRCQNVSSVSTEIVEKLSVPKSEAQGMIQNIPRRKTVGNLGRSIKVQANMLSIKFGSKFPSEVIHYDVNIEPKTPKYLMRPVFLKAKEKLFSNRNPAFDGKANAFSAGPLFNRDEISSDVIVFNEDGKEKQFKITIKRVAILNLLWLKELKPGVEPGDKMSITALDIILRAASAHNSQSIVGRSFFSAPAKGRVVSLGDGMDLWVGLFQSAILGWKPFLNIDVAHKGFPKAQSVIDLMKELCNVGDGNSGGRDQSYGRGGGRGGFRGGPGRGRGGYYGSDRSAGQSTELTPSLIEQFKRDIVSFLKGLKVCVQIPGKETSKRTYRVNDLVKCPKDNIFEHEGKKITVQDYYAIQKSYRIQYPHLPCLWVGQRDKNIHVPVELCSIVQGQATQKKLNENQTSNMIKYAATSSDIRKKKILESFAAMKHDNDPCMKEFDLSLSGEFETVDARVLDPPTLLYKDKKTARVQKGVWRTDRLQFLRPSSLLEKDNMWTILCLNQRTQEPDIVELANMLQGMGRNFAMPFGNPLQPFEMINPMNYNALKNYFDRKKKENLQLIIVIIPEVKGSYSKVKQITELAVGILTQCIKAKTVQKIMRDNRWETTVGNILLKINAKLTGTNHSIADGKDRPLCLNEPCMIVGADVTHPSPDAVNIPSIAAVTASHDPNAFKYDAQLRLQPAKQEIIEDFEEIIRLQLIYFYKTTTHKPSRIVVFRDGVSEGQFGQIMYAEVNAIRRACQKLDLNYKPRITFVVVQKRHHIRLFPTSLENSDDKNNNVQAGTIVDQKITHPTYIEYYLVSHASIQGTARPTKYCCLWDDSDFSINELEKLTYYLCHLFTRCNRSVSYPAPTYYAHLAAFRARNLIQDINVDMNHLSREQDRVLKIQDQILKEKPMFFV